MSALQMDEAARPHYSLSSGTTGSGSRDSSSTVDVTSTANGYGFRSTGGQAFTIEVSHLNPRRRFPLSDEHLPMVQLSWEAAQALKPRCEQMVADALASSSLFVWDGSNNALVGGDKGDWKPHYTRPHISLYRRRRKSKKKKKKDAAEGEEEESGGGSATQHFIARGQIHSMNLEDVEYGLYCDTTLDQRAIMTDLYGELFLDAAVLKAYENATAQDAFHFFGIKWLAHLAPADKFISSRDFCYLEYSKRVKGARGEPLLVKAMLALDSSSVSALNAREFDLVRGSMSSTYIYRFDAPHKNVQVFAQGHLDPSGSATSWIAKSFLSRFAPTIVSLEHSADVKYIMQHGMVMTTDTFLLALEANKKRLDGAKPQCVSCRKALGSGLVKRHAVLHCRACGQPACSHCLMTFTLCLPHHEKRNAEHPSAVIPEKFCFKCLYSGRLDRKGRRMDRFLQSHSSKSGSGADGEYDTASSIAQMTNLTLDCDEDDRQCQATGNGKAAARGTDTMSEQEHLHRLKMRHLANEKRKYLAQRHERALREQMQGVGGEFSGSERESSGSSNYSNSTPFAASRPGYPSFMSSSDSAASLSSSSSSSGMGDAMAFQQMERSLAEQGALLRSLQQGLNSHRGTVAYTPSNYSGHSFASAGYPSDALLSSAGGLRRPKLALPYAADSTPSTATTLSSHESLSHASWDQLE